MKPYTEAHVGVVWYKLSSNERMDGSSFNNGNTGAKTIMYKYMF